MSPAALLLSPSVASHTFTVKNLFSIIDKLIWFYRRAFNSEISGIGNFNINYKPRKAWAVRCNPPLWGGLEGLLL
jgi:hypothetical protein